MKRIHWRTKLRIAGHFKSGVSSIGRLAYFFVGNGRRKADRAIIEDCIRWVLLHRGGQL
jgi:hypothetical protein